MAVQNIIVTGRGEVETPSSILEKIKQKLPFDADKSQAVARKCNCRSVWCPICYRRFWLSSHYSRLSELPMNETRLLTLTLDREKVGIGPDAYVWLREKKALGRFFVRLESYGVAVHDWAGQIEFHRDGTPHFHLLVQTKAGPAGMIGNERLKKAWPWGGVREEYFKSPRHYNNTVGYFGKSGYFHKGKKYQTELPDYFRSEFFRGRKIARFYSARKASKKTADKTPAKRDSEKVKSKSLTSERVKDCGNKTLIFAFHDDEAGIPQSELSYLSTLEIPYDIFKSSFDGYYSNRQGYAFFLSGKAPPDFQTCPF